MNARTAVSVDPIPMPFGSNSEFNRHLGRSCSQLSDFFFFKKATPRKPSSLSASTTTCMTSSTVTESAVNKNTIDHQKLTAWTSIPQERWEGPLNVEGQIPPWLSGTYLRNGPGLWHIDQYNFRHLFDGYAMLVAVHFNNGHVTAGHRLLHSDAYNEAMKKRKICYREFSEAPLSSNGLFSSIGQIIGIISGSSLTDNANTGVVVLGDGRVLCLTETVKGTVEIDPETLDTIGRFEYEDSLGGLIHSAHPVVTKSEFLTLLPDLVNPGYRVVRMEPGTNKRELIGKVNCRGRPAPGWVHSFPVTENYVVVPEMPLRYSVNNLLKAEPTPLYKFEWYPESGAFMHVVCKNTGNMVASVEVPPFVTFHFINAYEERDETGRVWAIVADCCEHNGDATILDKLRLQNLRLFAGKDVLPDARVGRFIIPLNGNPEGKLESALDADKHGRGMDMCSINPAFLGKKYRYAYACGASRPCNFPNTLTKIDLEEKTSTNWHEDGSVPSEPFFISRPGATREDDGVVISIISDNKGGGYALLLDGITYTEIARARFPYGLPYGLHGCWIPKNYAITEPA